MPGRSSRLSGRRIIASSWRTNASGSTASAIPKTVEISRSSACPVGVDYVWEQPARYLVKAALLRACDQGSPRVGLLGGIGSGRGVKQGEAPDAIRIGPHNFQGDVAPQGEASQRESSFWGRGIEHRARHLRQGGTPRDVDHYRGSTRPQDGRPGTATESIVAQQSPGTSTSGILPSRVSSTTRSRFLIKSF